MRLTERSLPYLQVLPLSLVLLVFLGASLAVVVVVRRDGSDIRSHLGPSEGRYR